MRSRIRSAVVVTCTIVLGAACGGGGGGGDGGGTTPPDVVPVNCNSGAATLDGSFKAPNGTTPVVGADVTISSAAGCVAKTSATGLFKFLGLPATAATVTATKGVFQVSVPNVTPGATPVAIAIPANAVSFAYVAGAFDSIETILTTLGFAPAPLTAGELATANLAQYDAIFLNCGLDETFVGDAPTNTALQGYVSGGGTLYASDYAYAYVSSAFPGKVNFLQPDPHVGEATTAPVTAQILDLALQTALGRNTALITFDLGAWVVIDSAPAGTPVLITGPATYFDLNTLAEVTVTKPYVVQFTQGTGRVTFTSFHNEAQATADMEKLLESMVFGL
jgi:hypothetical protein